MTEQKPSQIRLYNILFPVWMLLWVPGWWWLLLIPGNFLIDFWILRTCFRKRNLPEISSLLKNCAWKTCLLGFLCDFIGSIVLLAVFSGISMLAELIHDRGNPEFGNMLSGWAGSAMLGQWNNPLILITFAGIALSAYLIFIFNRNMLRKHPDIGAENADYTAKRLALMTAPYLFLLPLY